MVWVGSWNVEQLGEEMEEQRLSWLRPRKDIDYSFTACIRGNFFLYYIYILPYHNREGSGTSTPSVLQNQRWSFLLMISYRNAI